MQDEGGNARAESASVMDRRKRGEAKPTTVDVARRAGVSIATVSRVLNGADSVSAEAYRIVTEAIRELGYVPNRTAQQLRSGKGRSVGLLVSDVEQTVYSTLTRHVQAAIADLDLDLVLYNLNHRAEQLERVLEEAPSLGLRAIILASSDRIDDVLLARHRDNLDRHGIPILAVGQRFDHLGIHSIVHEERSAAERSVSYLIDRGYRRIAFVGRTEGSVTGLNRFLGYQDAHRRHGLDLVPGLVWDVAYRYAAGHEAVAQAVAAGRSYDAIQAASDEMALGVIAALRDEGKDVPGDVAVVGFGDTPWASYLRPALTTLSSDPTTIAQHLSDAMRLIDRDSLPRGVIEIPRRLLIRGTA